jgi:hypothetical protein
MAPLVFFAIAKGLIKVDDVVKVDLIKVDDVVKVEVVEVLLFIYDISEKFRKLTRVNSNTSELNVSLGRIA